MVDSVTGMRTSVLTINDAAFSDSGRITCKNPSDIFDTDAVVVRVSSFEEGWCLVVSSVCPLSGRRRVSAGPGG